jgi:hypothetical protein
MEALRAQDYAGPVEGTLNILVCGDRPDGSEANEQLRMLARACHLRADATVRAAWLFSGPNREDWADSAEEVLVLDDLRTWAPAAFAERFSPTLAGKIRGLRARMVFRRLGPVDVVIADRAVGADLIDRVTAGPSCVAAAFLGPEAPLDSARRRVEHIDLVIGREDLADAPVEAPTLELPRLLDGSWERFRALPTARSTIKRLRGMGQGPLVVACGDARDDASTLAFVTAAGRVAAERASAGAEQAHWYWVDTGAHPDDAATGILTTAGPDDLAIELLSSYDVDLLSCTDVCVSFGVPADHELRRSLTVLGSASVDGTTDVEQLAVRIRAALDDVSDDARNARTEQARLDLDATGRAVAVVERLRTLARKGGR